MMPWYPPGVNDPLLKVTQFCEQYFEIKNMFITTLFVKKLVIVKKQRVFIRVYCICHVQYIMQCLSCDHLLLSMVADSLLDLKIHSCCITTIIYLQLL